MVSLVTGASGFIGSHLVDALLAAGDTVVTLQRSPAAPRERLLAIAGDVTDRPLLERIVGEHAPQRIFHLAAQSLPRVSWEDPRGTHDINVGGTLNLLDAVRAAKASPAIVIASSSSIYAQSTDGRPIAEDDPCRPASPYGVSKLAADHLGRLYAEAHGLRVTLARPFFLIGPRKVGDVCSDWARNIVAIERGRAAELSVGNVEVIRDFLHVADGIDAFLAIAAGGRPGEAYNICSGRGHALAEVLALLRGMACTQIPVREDPARRRALDERIKVGDPARLQALGWKERRGVEGALRDILAHWRAQP